MYGSATCGASGLWLERGSATGSARLNLSVPEFLCILSQTQVGIKIEMTPEQLADWFYDILAKHLNADKIRRKIFHLQVNPPEPRPRVYVQDSFFREVNA